MDYLNRVIEFHKSIGYTGPDTPSLPDPERSFMRIRLIREELKELEEAIEKEDITQIAKELADLKYVVFGADIDFGFIRKVDQFNRLADEIFSEVHRSNMTKTMAEAQEAEQEADLFREKGIRCEVRQIEDRFAVIREDGKLLKPSFYESADISQILKTAHLRWKVEASPMNK